MKPNELIAKIENGELDKNFKKIYVSDSAVEEQKPRYIRTSLSIFSAMTGTYLF